jgi:hypothetical protein
MIRSSRKKDLSYIVQTFLQFQNDVKIYHWQTFSYSRHKSSDALYQTLVNLIDEFVETFMGQLETHVRISSTLKLKNISDKQIPNTLRKFKLFLQNLDKRVPYMTTDLLNIRDELLGVTDKTMYLLTLH